MPWNTVSYIPALPLHARKPRHPGALYGSATGTEAKGSQHVTLNPFSPFHIICIPDSSSRLAVVSFFPIGGLGSSGRSELVLQVAEAVWGGCQVAGAVGWFG